MINFMHVMNTVFILMKYSNYLKIDAVSKPITSGIELCRVSGPTILPMDYATEADDMGPTGVSQIPRRESQHQSDTQVASQCKRPQPLVSKPCDHTADMIPRSVNANPPTVSQDRTRPLLNNSGHRFENCTGSRLRVDDTTISANSTISNSTNAILSISSHNRTRSISTNSGHCKENCTGSHLENEVTV
jgi:hypothetical protein